MPDIQHVLVTGGAGFIGANFLHLLRQERPDWRVTCLDSLTYAGNLANLAPLDDWASFRFVKGDICDGALVASLLADNVDAVVNFAAESHVDRSILGCQEFIRTNVEGTQVLLDAARQHHLPRFLQVSTDEVYGSLGPTGKFTESTPLAPNSPYSASKAAADLLVQAYHHTFDFPALITRCSNNYGPYQFPEKVIPLFVTNLFEGKKIPLYGDGRNVRDWIHVSDHCRAVLAVLERGRPGQVYNAGGDSELTNLELTHTLLRLTGRDESSIEYVKDRLGHDRRYAIDFTKIHDELGWSPQVPLEQGFADTVEWYRSHESWWRAIKSGEYLEYYARQYSQ